MKNRVIFSLLILLTGGEVAAHTPGNETATGGLAHLLLTGHHGVPLAIVSAIAVTAICTYYFVKARSGENRDI